MPLLGVNIDHVATLRQQRGTKYPDPVAAASICELAGADGITLHLREDRRHIQDRDVEILKQTLQTRMNLEMAVTDEMIAIAQRIKPHSVCLVPEKRQELTTEGGLDVLSHQAKVKDAILKLNEVGIQVSLFIDPDSKQIEVSKQLGAQMIEIHTGSYCESGAKTQKQEFDKIFKSISLAKTLNLTCNAGHGLDYANISPLARHKDIYEFNIGHSIVSRAVLVGLSQAVKEMVRLIKK